MKARTRIGLQIMLWIARVLIELPWGMKNRDILEHDLSSFARAIRELGQDEEDKQS